MMNKTLDSSGGWNLGQQQRIIEEHESAGRAFCPGDRARLAGRRRTGTRSGQIILTCPHCWHWLTYSAEAPIPRAAAHAPRSAVSARAARAPRAAAIARR